MFLFFADEISYYWFHRLNHEVRLLWAGHISHHPSVKMNFGTALRQGVGDERIHKFLFLLWASFTWFLTPPPLIIFTMIGGGKFNLSILGTYRIDKQTSKNYRIYF